MGNLGAAQGHKATPRFEHEAGRKQAQKTGRKHWDSTISRPGVIQNESQMRTLRAERSKYPNPPGTMVRKAGGDCK